MNLEILETERLYLTRLTIEDVQYIFNHWSQEQIMELYGHETEEDFLKEQFKSLKGLATYRTSVMRFLLKEKASGVVFGLGGFHNWYAEHRRAEIGYHITKEAFKRKGFMSEAVPMMVAYGFKEMDLHRMEAYVGKDNQASLRLLYKNNFKQEGLLKQHFFVDDERVDSVVLGLLKKEYNDTVI